MEFAASVQLPLTLVTRVAGIPVETGFQRSHIAQPVDQPVLLVLRDMVPILPRILWQNVLQAIGGALKVKVPPGPLPFDLEKKNRTTFLLRALVVRSSFSVKAA